MAITGSATGKVTATRKSDGRVLREKEIHEKQEFDLNPGNAATSIGNTRGFKKWASTQDGGLTVEATVTVTLTCNQDLKTIQLAGAMAGNLAEGLAREGIKEMQQYFDEEGH